MFQYADNPFMNFMAVPNIINLDSFRISLFEIILLILVLIVFIALPMYQQWSHIRKGIRTLWNTPVK